MLKKILGLLTVGAISIIYIMGCTPQTRTDNIVENNILIYDQESNSGISYNKVEIDNNIKIVALIDGNIIFSRYNENGSSISYYKFDIDKNTTYELGTIENPYIYRNSIARIEDRLYFYMNTTRDSSDQETSIDTTLYEINIEENTLEAIITEELYQTLVYFNVKDSDIISYKGVVNDNSSITYLDTISFDDNHKWSQDILMSNTYDNENGDGEIIYNFAIYEGYIYTITVEVQNGVREYIIKKYNSDGHHLQSIELDKDIKSLINNERIDKFEILGQYAFIRNLSGQGVLCDISGNQATAKLIDIDDLDIPISEKDNTSSYTCLIFKRSTCSLWLLDIDGKIIHELDTAFLNQHYYINSVRLKKGSTNILISLKDDDGNDFYYLDYLDIPIVKTYSLELDNVLGIQ